MEMAPAREPQGRHHDNDPDLLDAKQLKSD